MTALAPRPTPAEDKYEADGSVLISGIQAIVRLMLEQRRRDAARGLNTGSFVSGYQGSPLGGLDKELERVAHLLEPADIVFKPGVNEELGATAVGGTQLIGELAGRRKDGITGYWYGKNPGFDRAADAIRHATLSGTSPLGGAVALIGDDPASKSSTVPSSCEPMCRSLVMPVLAPATVAEILTLGLHAVALSRHAGLWTGLKIVADIADASATVEIDSILPETPAFAPRSSFTPPVLLPPTNLDAEHDLMTARLERVYEYSRAAGLNRIVFEPSRARFGVVAAGLGFAAVQRALDDLGLDEAACEAVGLRLVKLAMPWPLHRDEVRALVGDLESVLVVEDKLPFVEQLVREALYRQPNEPLVLGKEDEEGRPLLPSRSTVGADDVAAALLRVLPSELLADRVTRRPRGPVSLPVLSVARTPYFCSGCPHSSSTKAGPDQLVGAGIGCHIMVATDSGNRRGHLLGMPQMGGEGAQWLGLAPFTSEPHFIQNLGDGTFHHSGSLAIRGAVAAGVNMTYRILYNDVVAMTGGQDPVGGMPIPQLIKGLASEGVKRVVVTTPDPKRYKGVKLDRIATVRHRDDIEDVLAELAAVPGVTVMLHDDMCATEKRRLRKRGRLAAPAERVVINERVCEGCGDCGDTSTCLSVIPVETAFGRKTQIHQSSCNQDFSCTKGDCPSFLMVTPAAGPAKRQVPAPPSSFPAPVLRVPSEDVLIRMTGVGGTGVVSIAATLQRAAQLSGRHAAGVEQTGLAQKGGAVLSDLRISATPITGQIKASAGAADVLLGFDLLGAVGAATLPVLDRERTVAILNTDITPTASMVTDPNVTAPESARLVKRVELATRGGELVSVAAETISEALFGDHMPVNMLLVGAAFQHGCLPLPLEALEQAIEGGAGAKTSLAAFRWGRALVADPAAVMAATGTPSAAREQALIERARGILAQVGVREELRDVLELRVTELLGYQNARYAESYARDVVGFAARAEAAAGTDGLEIAREYAKGLFKLMAYKDEYEVARLHLDSVERAKVTAEFGADAKVAIMLHPPVLRAMGLKRKLKFGRAATPLLRTLYSARGLRGTRLDPFGRAEVRKVERALIAEYQSMAATALEQLSSANAGLVRELVALPDVIRGYEEIKLRNVERFRTEAAALLGRITAGEVAPTSDPAVLLGLQ